MNLMIVNLNVCRVCLKIVPDSLKMFSDLELLEKFSYCTQLKVVPNDGMPGLLCPRCNLKLKIAYDFRKQTLISESHLRAFITEMNRKFQQVTEQFETLNEENIDELSELLTDNEKLKYHYTMKKEQNGNFLEQENINTLKSSEKTDQNEMTNSNININNDWEHEINDEIDDLKTHLLPTNLFEKSNDIRNDKIDTKSEESQSPLTNESHESNQYLESENKYDGASKIDEIMDQQDSQSNEVFEKYIELDVDDSVTYYTEINLNGDSQTNSIANDLVTNGKPFKLKLVKTDDLQYRVEYKKDLLQTMEMSEELTENLTTEFDKTVEIPNIEVTDDRNNLCVKCGKQFSSKTNLIRHFQTHFNVKPYKCQQCGAGFTQRGSLKAHMNSHYGIKPYKCQICNQSFTQGKSLTFHMRRHTGEKPFKCEFCSFEFRQKDGLKRHLLAKHHGNKPVSSEVFLCGLCNRILHSKYAMDQHSKKHKNQIIQLRCFVCKQTFSTKGELDTHQDSAHANHFQCPKCPRTFSRNTSLLNHMRLHFNSINDDEKKQIFSCKKCGKKFSLKKNFLQHLQSHISKKELDIYNVINANSNRCEACDLSFDHFENLCAHLKEAHDVCQ